MMKKIYLVPIVLFCALFIGVSACSGGSFVTMGDLFQSDDEGGTSAQSQAVHLPPDGATAMSASAFSDLKSQVDDAHMSSDKLGVISTASASNYFTASQVAQLVEMLDMADDRVTVVETTGHRILDLENSHVILNTLTFDQERRSAEDILQGIAQARDQERARIAEEERKRQEEQARIAEEERQRAQEQSHAADEEPQQAQSSSSDSSAYCCLGGSYNECDNAAAAGACVNYGMCIFGCMMGGDPTCEDDCFDENPRVEQCRAVPSKDHLCDD